MYAFDCPLTVEDIKKIHSDQLQLYGGESGIRYPEGIESSVGCIKNGYYGSVLDAASALMVSLGKNHCFVDGNKRVAFFSATAFLEMYGYYLDFDDTKAGHELTQLIADCNFTKQAVYDWLIPHLKVIED